MTILHISDTHGQHSFIKKLPTAEIIIHTGDFSNKGTLAEITDFLNWFTALPYPYKIFIGGNHDEGLYEYPFKNLPENCFYLCNSGITIQNIHFYGIPMFLEDIMMGTYDKNIQKIPKNTDILLTHQPPYTILDDSENTHFGDMLLYDKVMEVKPKYHLFGHIHSCYGRKSINNTTFFNTAMVDENYQLKNEGFVFTI